MQGEQCWAAGRSCLERLGILEVSCSCSLLCCGKNSSALVWLFPHQLLGKTMIIVKSTFQIPGMSRDQWPFLVLDGYMVPHLNHLGIFYHISSYCWTWSIHLWFSAWTYYQSPSSQSWGCYKSLGSVEGLEVSSIPDRNQSGAFYTVKFLIGHE